MHPYISVVQVSSFAFPLQDSGMEAAAAAETFRFCSSALQILSFILIRNIPGYVRSIYSSFFAWFGKISLEVRGVTRTAERRLRLP